MKCLIPLLCSLSLHAAAADMTEIRFLDQEPEQAAYTSRILILEERMRLDHGRDDEDFILYDRAAGMVWLVAHAERRLTGIPVIPTAQVAAWVPWPQGWQTRHVPVADGQALLQERLNDEPCLAYRTAPILKAEAALLRDFERALAGNHAQAWKATPEDLREPCVLLNDVHQPGVAYEQGLPLLIRYWDGRSREYQGHAKLPARAALFELPGTGYARFIIGERAPR